MHSIELFAMARRTEHELKLRNRLRLSHLGASLAPNTDLQAAPQPRRRNGWLPGFVRSAAS